MQSRARSRPPARRLLHDLAGLAAWTLVLLGASAPAPAGGAHAAPGAAHPAPKLEPLPAALERRMIDLVHAAEHYRGLKLERRVPWGRVSEADLRREVTADFQQDLPPERLAAVELSLKAFGLIPENMELATYLPELLTSQIAGFYDPHRKVLAVVDRPGGLLGKAAFAQLGADTVRKMEDGLLVHELTHAIQDQHFDLDRLSDPDPLSDSGVARLALVEGDASLVMFDDLVERPLEQLPEAKKVVSEMLADAGADGEDGANGPDDAHGADAAGSDAVGGSGAAPGGPRPLPGEKEMANAPAWFRDQLLFSYSRGAAFCLEVRQHGGQKLLDYAFAVDPPRSSEQILHPEKWYGRRDDPVVILWPDLGQDLPGYAKAAEGQLGEEGIGVLLRSVRLNGQRDGQRAAAAAEGWGGDRFAVYRKAGRRLLAWIADWDTDEAAGRFQTAASRLGGGWLVTRAGPRRVTLLRGDLETAQRTAVLARLAAARAEPPANRAIDLARLGARPDPAAAAPPSAGPPAAPEKRVPPPRGPRRR
jgi:hypothetical protein